MMCKIKDSQDLKSKKEGRWVLHWNFYTTANSNSSQISISGMPLVVYLTLSFLSNPIC